MISLRPYQQRMIDETREAMRQHRRVLLQAPTGAGKTAITVHMMGESAKRGISSVFCVHQNELLRQTSAALWKQSLEHGVIAAGRVTSKLPAQVASVQTLVRRLDQYSQPGLIIIDECMAAGTMIETMRGSMPIEKVRVGDRVMAYNGDSVIWAHVSDKWETPNREIMQLKTACGKLINCTGNHKLLCSTGWKRADSLNPGDLLFSANAAVASRYLKTDGAIKEDFCLGTTLQSSQWSSGISNIKRQLIRSHIAPAVVVKKLGSSTAIRLKSSLLLADAKPITNMCRDTTSAAKRGIPKSRPSSAKRFLAHYLAIRHCFMLMQKQLRREFAATIATNRKHGRGTRRAYLPDSCQRLKFGKMADLARCMYASQQNLFMNLFQFTKCATRESKSAFQKNGLTGLVRLAWHGGFATTARRQAEAQIYTPRDLHLKTRRLLRIGFARNMALQIWSMLAATGKNFICLPKHREQFFRSLNSIFLNQCNTSWTPIESVQLLPNRETVYDITVPETSNFFANGVLAHNCHRAAASTYRRVLDAWPDARVIGLTATPERTDGKGLDDIFDTIVLGPQIRELMDGGYLCEYDLLAPPSTVSMDDVRTVGGDYDADAAADIVDRPTITGDAVAHYQKHAAGQRCVVMAINLKHAAHVADAYNAAGIRAEVISGETTDRVAILERFASGQTLVLVNVQLMIEGVDIPAIQAVQWLRPTKSLIVWMQGNGRGLRPAEGKSALTILDHVGNWSRPGFGMPDAERQWSLAGRKERAKRESVEAFDVRQCPACYAVYRATLTVCPKCSTEGRKTQREIEVIAGELARVEAETAQRDRKREVGRARTLEELIQVGIRRGMSRPAEWAAHTVAAREGRKAGPADYAQAHRVHARMIMGNA